MVTSGITTVFDCLRLGSDADDGFEKGEMRSMADALLEAKKEDRLRADHLIHLRCEVSTTNVLEHFEDFRSDPQVRLVSLMDHAPGQRQFQTMEQYTLYYKTKRGLSDEAFAAFVARRRRSRPNMPCRIARRCRRPAPRAASRSPAMTMRRWRMSRIDRPRRASCRIPDLAGGRPCLA